MAYLREDVWETLSRDGSEPDLGEPITDPAVIQRRRRFRRLVIAVMAGAVALLAVGVVRGTLRASQVEATGAASTSPPIAPAAQAVAQQVPAPTELQDTHGGGPPTSPNAARFHRPKSAPTHKARNGSVLPR